MSLDCPTILCNDDPCPVVQCLDSRCVVFEQCGPTLCGEDFFCCNESCGICVPVGESCDQTAECAGTFLILYLIFHVCDKKIVPSSLVFFFI